MKFDSKQKIVLFYGNILRISSNTEYLAADGNGEVFAYTSKPKLVKYDRIWECTYGYSTTLVATFEKGESWMDSLTYCEGEGQEWMLDLKTKIAVEYALQEAGAIKRQDALCNVIDSCPFDKRFLSQHWDAFRKHSGVESVASKEFLDALKVKSETPLFIKAEKFVYPEDDSLLIRDYRGAGLIIPKWVRFIAMDSDGSVWGYEEQPEVNTAEDGEWATVGGRNARRVGWRSQNTAEKEWRYSLREVQK